jgi:hypothetical protein
LQLNGTIGNNKRPPSFSGTKGEIVVSNNNIV